MRLDPTDNANQGDNGCEYGDICGPANNVVKVPKEKSKTSRITRSQSGVAEHLAMVQKAKEGSLVAAHSKTEPEAWFLGVVTKTAYKPNVTFKGRRGERVIEGEWHLEVRKLEDAVTAPNYYEEVPDSDGLMHVQVNQVVAVDVMAVTKDMRRSAKIDAMGSEWGKLSRKEGRDLLASQYTYLPEAQREYVWLVCPK